MTDPAETQPLPPIAPVHPHSKIRHGEVVHDDYSWLREKTNLEVARYLEAENAYTEAMTAAIGPLSESLYREILSHLKQTDLSVPVRRGKYLYYSRTEEGKQYAIQCRRAGDIESPEEILLDPNELAKTHPFVGLGAMAISDDDTLLAYSVDFTGFRQYTLYVKDLRNGATLPDTFDLVTGIAWAAGNRTLFVTTEDPVTKRPHKLWRHALGMEEFKPVYEETDERYDIDLAKTRDKQYLLLGAESKDTAEWRYLRADRPQEEFRIFLPRETGHRYYIDHREETFYIRTDRPGVNFAVMTAPAADVAEAPRPERWQMFLEHRADVLLLDLDLFRDFAVSIEKTAAVNRLRIYDFACSKWREIECSEPVYLASPGGTPEFTSPTYRYEYQSPVTPRGVYDYDIRTGQSTLLKRQEVPGGYDPEQYAAERLWATARDGARIPISIVYKKNRPRDVPGPLLLSGYGSYGIGMSAGFSISRLPLLDRGVACAIAHIRGGDEMGWQWRLDGMLMRKKNTFFDFIDAADFLIRKKWTAPGKLQIEGGSAGGLLIGAVVNLRPELFRAAHLAVPFVDVVNTMMDPSLPLTVGEYLEWGDPNQKAAYEYMKSYSPYDNLAKGAYPAMLVTTSFNDSQVMYWEPAKYVARLRTLKTDSNPLLLKIKMEPAGHGGASGRYDHLRDQAFEYAWMLAQVGIEK